MRIFTLLTLYLSFTYSCYIRTAVLVLSDYFIIPTPICLELRGVLFIVRAGGDMIKAEFMHTKRTNCLTKMKIGVHLEELK